MRPLAFALAIFVAVTTSFGEKHESWILNDPKVAKWDQKIATADDRNDWSDIWGSGSISNLKLEIAWIRFAI